MSEFSHYGRLGMKWYQHIFGKEQAQAKYSKRQAKKNPQEAINIFKEARQKVISDGLDYEVNVVKALRNNKITEEEFTKMFSKYEGNDYEYYTSIYEDKLSRESELRRAYYEIGYSLCQLKTLNNVTLNDLNQALSSRGNYDLNLGQIWTEKTWNSLISQFGEDYSNKLADTVLEKFPKIEELDKVFKKD